MLKNISSFEIILSDTYTDKQIFTIMGGEEFRFVIKHFESLSKRKLDIRKTVVLSTYGYNYTGDITLLIALLSNKEIGDQLYDMLPNVKTSAVTIDVVYYDEDLKDSVRHTIKLKESVLDTVFQYSAYSGVQSVDVLFLHANGGVNTVKPTPVDNTRFNPVINSLKMEIFKTTDEISIGLDKDNLQYVTYGKSPESLQRLRMQVVHEDLDKALVVWVYRSNPAFISSVITMMSLMACLEETQSDLLREHLTLTTNGLEQMVSLVNTRGKRSEVTTIDTYQTFTW